MPWGYKRSDDVKKCQQSVVAMNTPLTIVQAPEVEHALIQIESN
jgi:hypothetical protein